MRVLLVLSLWLVSGSKLELDEDPIEVRVPTVGERDDAAVTAALAVILKPASSAALYEAVQVCGLLGVDAGKAIAAAKQGSATGLDERLLAIADGYLGLGDWVNAEKALRAVRPSVGVHERLGRVLRAQGRFPDAARAYVAALDSGSGAELDEAVRRIVPVTREWVADYETGRAPALREVAKSVLTAMLPHQAGEGSEATKALLARLAVKPPAGKRATLTATRVRDALAVQLPALRGCYARALVHDPTLKGKLVVAFSTDETGAVSSLAVTTDGIGSKTLRACVEPRLKALNLVAEAADVTYPLAFIPL